ncbi:MAG: class I SAM-dependent methyltransferase [Planctomycetota bacterium]|jgi:SAM-dependent methyltransferase
MTIFDRFAAAFPLVSDERERWRHEGPLLVKLAREAGGPGARVLDLACGSGFHARHLAAEGFRVTGLDVSAGAIAAGRALPGGDLVEWREGDIMRPLVRGDKGAYELALLVGNTLSLLDDEADVAAAFGVASSALTPGGVLVAHVIDFARLRAHPVRISREGELEGGPVGFEKRIDPAPGGAVITISVTRQGPDGDRTERATQPLREWGARLLIEKAREAGLGLRDELGSLDGSPREPGVTKDVVLLFRKRAG